MHALRWLEAPAAFDEACAALERGECPYWGNPITLGPEERLLQAVDARPSGDLEGLLVEIRTSGAAVAAWLAEFCRFERAAVVLKQEPTLATRAAHVILWQVSDDDLAAAELDRLRARSSPACIVALLSFPRVEQADRLRTAGVQQVLSLPASPELLTRAVAAAAGAATAASPESD
jgi:hypothetical protein